MGAGSGGHSFPPSSWFLEAYTSFPDVRLFFPRAFFVDTSPAVPLLPSHASRHKNEIVALVAFLPFCILSYSHERFFLCFSLVGGGSLSRLVPTASLLLGEGFLSLS